MKKNKKCLKVSVTTIIMLCMLILGVGQITVAASDYYQESLYFDEDGNFFMTTHDAVATKTTRYCTLGWTIKRYDLPIDDPLNMCATIIITCDGSVEDPENDRYLYSFFYCDKESIFDAIGSVSKEWQRELYLNGATVYLDGIMTVIEKDVVLGSLFPGGGRSGEVYDTYDGIVSARNWGVNSKNSLRTHFNKNVYFPAVKSFFEGEEAKENIEEGVIRLGFDGNEAEFDAGVTISSSSYNPNTAIPSGEKVKLSAWQQAYAYEVKYRKVTGEHVQKIPISIIAQKTVADETGAPTKTEAVITETTYDLLMPYTYYAIDEVTVYYADGVYVSSDAFGKGYYIDTGYEPNVEVVMREDTEDHVMSEAVTEAIEVNIGEITDAQEIEEYIRAKLKNFIGKPKVRNDYLSIEGDVLMTDDWTDEGEVPTQTIYWTDTVSDNMNITIPAQTLNGEYSVSAEAYYDYISFGNAKADYISMNISGVGKINVHTPVVCNGKVSDVKEWNQAANPSKNNPTIVLGKDFVVTLSNRGGHIDAKGYGENNYNKYVLYNQVKFPFEVFDETGKIYSADTWISMEQIRHFVLPIAVIEGKYEIEYRTVAYNFCEEETGYDCTEQKANLFPQNYIATDTVTVEVVGQLYGFVLTEFVEYKKIINMEECGGVRDVSKLPFVYGEKGAPLGSYFRFRLESVGSYEKGATVTIIPSFWYIGQNATEEVDIYYEDIRADGQTILKKWSVDGHRLELTESYVLDGNAEIVNGNGRHRFWTGIYMLPMRSFCLPKGEVLPMYGIDKESFLEEGRILIKFDIMIEDEYGKNVLLYINAVNEKEGYCNRWKKEGGEDGEVIIYDMDKSVKNSMKITGTH